MTPQGTIIPYGFCLCGCGEKTRICAVNCTRDKRVKGEPDRYISGHQRRIRPTIEDAVPFKVDGVYCRLIFLGDGFYSIVDSADYEWLMQWKWWKAWSESTKSYYAIRGAERINGHNRPLSMQRQIMGLTFGDEREVDHENHNTLDNRRKNLRFANYFEQSYNRRRRSDNTSGFKGVCYRENRKGPDKWRARISAGGKRILLGYFATADKAGEAYAKAALEYHREFAHIG